MRAKRSPLRLCRVATEEGDSQLEREGDPARWLAYVTEGCFKYVTHGLSDDREHITWLDKSLTLGQLQASLLGSH